MINEGYFANDNLDQGTIHHLDVYVSTHGEIISMSQFEDKREHFNKSYEALPQKKTGGCKMAHLLCYPYVDICSFDVASPLYLNK